VEVKNRRTGEKKELTIEAAPKAMAG